MQLFVKEQVAVPGRSFTCRQELSTEADLVAQSQSRRLRLDKSIRTQLNGESRAMLRPHRAAWAIALLQSSNFSMRDELLEPESEGQSRNTGTDNDDFRHDWVEGIACSSAAGIVKRR